MAVSQVDRFEPGKDYDGYTPTSWVFFSYAPEVPGLAMERLPIGFVNVVFLQKVGSRYMWCCRSDQLFTSSERARRSFW